MPSKDTNTGAKRARQLRAELRVGDSEPIQCLLTLAERRLEFPVAVAALPSSVAGCCWREEERVVLWLNGTQPAVRQRFTLAHELGHVRCAHDGRVPVETFTTLAGTQTDSREVQANAFAAELLAPAAGVQAMVDGEPTLDDVVLISARFGISTIAALYRLNSLGCTGRYEQLKAEIDDGLDGDAWARIDPPAVEDLISELEASDLPRLSPALAGSALEALLTGKSSVGDVAGAVGCDPQQLSNGAFWLGR